VVQEALAVLGWQVASVVASVVGQEGDLVAWLGQLREVA
jgi:hypothetical protein